MTQTPDPVRYLDQIAASAPGRHYKQRLLAALRLRSGQTVVDVGSARVLASRAGGGRRIRRRREGSRDNRTTNIAPRPRV